MTLRVSLEGRVSCTRPRGTSLAEAEAFVAAKAGWVSSRLAGLPPPESVAEGAPLPVEGRLLTIERAAVAEVRREGDRLLVPEGGAAGASVARWLAALAAERARSACEGHAARLNRPVGRVRVRDTRSRWGSCTARGDVMLCWRLAMAPPEVLSYVAAHEVAHLERMDHSPAFWAVVERLDPSWRDRRAWLRRHGPALLRRRFG